MTNNWNANLYDGKHSFVSTFGNDLVNVLAPEKKEKILDLGCGTGDLANRLYELGVDVTGIDQSENMIHQAINKYPHIPFNVHNAIKLDYMNEFDAVFSNATLHWVKEADEALHCIYRSLKQGGRFVAEFGGKGNVQLITSEIINQLKSLNTNYKEENFPWYFPSIGEYSSLMEKSGFRVTFAQHFDRPTALEGENGLRNWITMFAGNMFRNIDEDIQEAAIRNAENNLKEVLYSNGSWTADYKRIRVVGIKE
ncbi:class I SAM-dependent methyltransferase [Metabacillus fastidiosus]|uniref:Methyltransferase domain-containing protein n=1 Tax=Metabacillus fastidiosus TaxID=1458 RepID=A0ABU6NWS2_9BACI|nr:class I SAM-dependent methyltransferase [Metabacillus fastidiosus]MED4401572.1 methyltransferase domain-containing protein [Metabacillus fastidiosus]MED4463207.1 methyltransferase domain-containing protein [Metabacillus fastidiosus]